MGDLSISNPTFNQLEIVQKGTATIPLAGDGATESVTVNHNLGYIPIAIAYIDGGGVRIPLPYLAVVDSGTDEGKIEQYIDFYVNSTQVVLSNKSPLGSHAGVTATYYLLREQAN